MRNVLYTLILMVASSGCATDDSAPPPTLRQLLAEQALQEKGCTKQQVFLDHDGDGYGNANTSFMSCSIPQGYVKKAGDCRDDAKSVNPGAPEICDGLDNNCNGQVDENASKAWYLDHDGDGHGDPAFKMDQGCNGSNYYVASSDDCDDSDQNRHPGAKEICDSLDNDCDGKVDNSVEDAPLWFKDYDQDGSGNAIQHIAACKKPKGFVDTPGDCNDANPAMSPNTKEICDNLDNDCDGQTDEGLKQKYFLDADSDGFGSNKFILACQAPKDYVENDLDCNDHDAHIAPWMWESCNGIDDNCNGQTDEWASDTTTFYFDGDSDGHGIKAKTINACEPPKGYVPVADDCDDSDATIHPKYVEICDNKDNDCDGQTDESDAMDALPVYVDSDKDGYGFSSISLKSCKVPPGFTSVPGDCNDEDAKVNPKAVEVCDGVDNNCDGVTDTDAVDQKDFYWDFDSDGYGAGQSVFKGCATSSNLFATNNKDCDDKDNDTYPSAMEICDFEDNDCNGQVDDFCIL